MNVAAFFFSTITAWVIGIIHIYIYKHISNVRWTKKKETKPVTIVMVKRWWYTSFPISWEIRGLKRRPFTPVHPPARPTLAVPSTGWRVRVCADGQARVLHRRHHHVNATAFNSFVFFVVNGKLHTCNKYNSHTRALSNGPSNNASLNVSKRKKQI